ncbi:MAG: DNA polymerase IV [Saprospiraceae bacterium]|jgi:DNA polymerase-4
MFNRAILHLDLDAFFASVECLQNSTLRGRPLIVGGGHQRGVVMSCSYEARRFGVRSAMPMRVAKRLCPDAVVLRGDMEAYSRYSRLVTEVIADQSPGFEKASIDEFYIDLSGMDRYVGCWRWSQELRQRVMRESGLPISAALSVNKLVSKVGTGEAKPNGVRLIEMGAERGFLAPLQVGKLPSVGQVTEQRLHHMGVQHVHTLAAIPPALLQREFGKRGPELWRKANAIDDSPVVPYREQKAISTEHTLEVDTTDVRQLRELLTGMTLKLSYELRQQQWLTGCVTVKVRYADFSTYTKQRHIPYTATDRQLLEHASGLLEQLYQRRQLVRLVGLRYSHLVNGRQQMSLFEDSSREACLLAAMDRIRTRFGPDALTLASTL